MRIKRNHYTFTLKKQNTTAQLSMIDLRWSVVYYLYIIRELLGYCLSEFWERSLLFRGVVKKIIAGAYISIPYTYEK